MGKTDLVLYAVGGAFGVVGACGFLTYLWLRSCERASERGFGQ